MRAHYRLIMAIILIVLVVQAAPVTAASATKLRFVYASPDAPAIDILINGVNVISNMAFFSASLYQTYPEFGSGNLHVIVVPTSRSEPILAKADLTIVAGKIYTIAVFGILTQPQSQLKLDIVEDDLTIPAADTAHVRLVQAAADPAMLSMHIGQETPLTAGPTFQSASRYLPIAAKNYDKLQIAQANSGAVVLNLPAVTFEAGTIYDLFVVGEIGNLQAKIVTTTFPPVPRSLPKTAESGLPLHLLVMAAFVFIAAGLVVRHRASSCADGGRQSTICTSR